MKKLLTIFLVLGMIAPSCFANLMYTTYPLLTIYPLSSHQIETNNKFSICRQYKGGKTCYINHCKKYGGGNACISKYIKARNKSS